MLMEHSQEDLRTLDLFQIIGHLDAEGEITNVQQDSFGNLRVRPGGALRAAARPLNRLTVP